MFARGSAPFASESRSMSLPPRPKTWISSVFATVGLPVTGTLAKIAPAAVRPTSIVLSWLLPINVSTPLVRPGAGRASSGGGTTTPGGAASSGGAALAGVPLRSSPDAPSTAPTSAAVIL